MLVGRLVDYLVIQASRSDWQNMTISLGQLVTSRQELAQYNRKT